MATESEIKTSAERFLARAKEFAWLGAAAAALVTAIWGATTYINDKRLEYVKTFNEQQITLSFETAETVAKLLTAETKEDWDTHVAKFRTLYWGQLVLVESKKVAEAMVHLCNQMMKAPQFDQRDRLQKEVFEVSNALRQQIAKRNANDWRIDLPKLTYERDQSEGGVDPKSEGGVDPKSKRGLGC